MKGKRLTLGMQAAVIRQLADALGAGLTLRDTAAILERDTDLPPAQRRLVQRIRELAEADGTLSAALAEFAPAVPPEATALVREGEAAGRLPATLELLAADLELRRSRGLGIQGALAWPATILVVLFLVTAVIMIFVIPAFKQVFTSFGADLPGPTLLVMAVSDVFSEYGWLMLVALVAAAIWVARKGLVFPRLPVLERLVVRVPVVRGFVLKSFASRLAHVLARVGEQGVPAPAALAYVRATAQNAHVADVAAALEARLRQSPDVAAAVMGTPRMPAQLAVALEIGERSGRPAQALRQVVSISDAEALRSLVRLQQAILVGSYVLAGLIVGGVVIAMYLPIFKLGAVI